MLQYPFGVFPSGNTIDTSEPFQLTSFISGTDCVAYKLQILENVTGKNYYDGTKTQLPETLYNQDLLAITVANTLPTGLDYIYNYTLWTTNADIPISNGVIVETLGASVLTIGQYTLIKKGQTININGESQKILNYVWNDLTLLGTLTLESALSSIPEKGDSFKITSDFIETPYYYFKSLKTPIVTISNIPDTVASRLFEFIGVYSQLENTPIQSYKYSLYVLTDDGYTLLSETGNIYNSRLTYEYDGLINLNTYRIILSVTNQSGVSIETKNEFSVLYAQPITEGNLIAEFNDENNSVIVRFEDVDKTNILYWDIYREEINSNIQHKVGRLNVNDLGIEDFGVVNQTLYKWTAIPIALEVMASSLESNEIFTNWADWSLTSLYNDDDRYVPTKTCKLNLNLESADMVQNLDVVYHKNYTKYPKESRGQSNYLTGSITCLLGQIALDKQTSYTEKYFSIEQWRDFVYNGEPKLLKDRAGNKHFVSITTSSSNVDDVSVQQLNQINFSFTEIGDKNLTNNIYLVNNTEPPQIAELNMIQRGGNLYVDYDLEIFPIFELKDNSLYVDFQDKEPLDLSINLSGDLIQRY